MRTEEAISGYAVSVHAERSFLRITARGSYNFHATHRFIEFSRGECDRHRVQRVLVDMRLILGDWPSMDKFYIGEAVAKSTRLDLKIATIVPSEVLDGFGETVAVNRGAHIRVFATEAEAIAWLESD